MAQILFITKAMDTRSIGKKDTDIMQHGSLVYKLLIKTKFGMTPCQSKSKICNSPSMYHVNIFQFIFTWIVFVDYLLNIHKAKFYKAKITKITSRFRGYAEEKRPFIGILDILTNINIVIHLFLKLLYIFATTYII